MVDLTAFMLERTDFANFDEIFAKQRKFEKEWHRGIITENEYAHYTEILAGKVYEVARNEKN